MVEDMIACVIQISNESKNCNLPLRFDTTFIPGYDI